MSKQHVWLIKVCKIEATPTNGTILPVSQLELGVAFGDTEILVYIYMSIHNLYSSILG